MHGGILIYNNEDSQNKPNHTQPVWYWNGFFYDQTMRASHDLICTIDPHKHKHVRDLHVHVVLWHNNALNDRALKEYKADECDAEKHKMRTWTVKDYIMFCSKERILMFNGEKKMRRIPL